MENKVLAGLLLTTKGMLLKLTSLVSASWGWILMIFTSALNFFIPAKEMFHVLFLLLAVDTVTGLMT